MYRVYVELDRVYVEMGTFISFLDACDYACVLAEYPKYTQVKVVGSSESYDVK